MDERLRRITEMEERLNRIKAWLKDEASESVEDDVQVGLLLSVSFVAVGL